MSAVVTAPRRAAGERPRTATRRSTAPRAPRRVSGPVRGRTRAAQAPRENLAIGVRALALVRGLPDHSLIDRLVRGRAWIPVLGVLLAGIVAMQVEILKLGASMGRAMDQTTTLQTQNESLQASVATLADDQRIERLAAAMGMAMPTPGSVVFLSVHRGANVRRAVANIHAPDPAGFTSQLAAEAAAAAALMPASPTTSQTSTSGVTGPGTTTTATTTSAPVTTTSTSTPSSTTTSDAATQPTIASTAPTTGSTTSSATVAPSQTGANGAAGVAPVVISPSGTSAGG